MRSFAFISTILMTLPVLLSADSAVAEPPPTPASAQIHEDMTSDLVRSASNRVLKSFQMMLFEDQVSGSEAFFTVEPDFNPGCKVKLTVRF